MNTITEKALQEYCNKKVSNEAINFKKIYEEIKDIKNSNDKKGYKSGKLYFDILKKYDLSEIHHNKLVHGAYRVIAKDDDYNEIEKCILEESSKYNCPEQMFFEIAENFLNFTRTESMKIGQSIPAEKLKEVLETSYKNYSPFSKELNEIKNIIIENDAKDFILEALEIANLPWRNEISEEKLKELKLRVEKSFSK